MEKSVRIIAIGDTREFQSARTGEKIIRTDIAVEWKVEQPGRETYTQSCVASVKGQLNRPVLEQLKIEERQFVATMYVNAREYNGRYFTNVDMYIPKEYMMQ